MKILLLTSIYPIPNVKITGSTSVCHYFAKEWIKQGHEVIVINTYTVYPHILHWLSGLMEKTIANKFPVSINTIRFSEPFEYKIDGVRVLLTPTYKPFPKSGFSAKSIRKTANAITKFLNDNQFTPDIITSHFIHPNLELIPELKKVFPSIPCGINLHGQICSAKRIKEIDAAKSEIDFWGFRSYAIGESFLKNCFQPSDHLYCFSGVPQDYIQPESFHKHDKQSVGTFLFVGNLNHRKHPMAVMQALEQSGIKYTLAYIGSGKQSEEIAKSIHKHNLHTKVEMCGRLPRNEVSSRMSQTECFIMVSEDETFGLVYLEAMANGCIVIASRNEGMDGIIKNGVNGFLCEAGNKDELSEIIVTINKLSPVEKMTIAKSAISTASSMTDSKVARHYLDDLCHIASQNNEI